MITVHGESENLVLFTDGSRGVVVNSETNMVEDSGMLSEMSYLMPWGPCDSEPSDVMHELASAALSDLRVVALTASARMYTIPKGVQAEAKKALEWRKEYKRGGTPVGISTARTLAAGGQIGIKKVRHIAKYFPRHEIDKKAKGYDPGEDGYPSNGRIAWALWGGDSAWRWAKNIVERENKKAKTASGETVVDPYEEYSDQESMSISRYAKPAIDVFDLAQNISDGDCPEFIARVRLDGSGIDRLYMLGLDEVIYVWDDGDWDDLGHVDSDIYTYDRSLDDPYDVVEKRHILIDPQTALIISAHLQERPFTSVSVYSLNEEEAELAAAAADQIDWGEIDSVLTAAGEESDADGEYTPEERSAKARKQVRDKSGRFAKMGGRVVVDGDASKSGSISGIDPDTQSVTLKMDDGSSQTVRANRVQAEGTQPAMQTGPLTDTPGMPLDTRGILGEPRAPIDRPKAAIPGGLPALRSEDLQKIVNNYPAWVMEQRSGGADLQDKRVRGQKIQPAGDRAPEYQKSDYIRNMERESGEELFTKRAEHHPLLQDYFKKKPKESKIWYSPITSTAYDINENTVEPSKPGEELTPETSDVEPMYVAIVSPDDPQAVMDLVSVVPASSTSTSPTTFIREDGEWVKDEQILADLTSATPPPVVALTGEVYDDVLAQVDQTMTASGNYVYVFDENERRLLEMYGVEPLNTLMAAGGLDRNRGKAEKLRRYWTIGRGALKIRWNTPGDWTRCYRHLRKYMGPRAKGYCSLRHKEMTGVWPGSKYNVGKKKKSVRGSAEDLYDVLSEEQIIETSILRAKVADAKSRVLVAGGYKNSYGGCKFKIPLVIPEGAETGDGRVFKKGAITLRELPLPLLWQIKTGDGHNGSVVVGRIDHMERTDDGIGNAYGVFDTGAYGAEAERLVKNGFIRGVSADLDMFEASESDDDDDEILGDDSDEKAEELLEEVKKKVKKIGGGKIEVDKARVMAVTIVPKPAFQECRIYIEDEDSEDLQSQEEEMEVTPDGIYVEDLNDLDAQALVACGMVAGSIPIVPPAEWFQNPKLTKATPLTVTDEGQVYGHIAAWHVDHIGMAYGTKPPRSKSKYSYFHTGVLRADDGNDYPVGQLTLAGGHAPLEASASDAARHYDDTGSAIADVHAGEDSYGIWVAGSLRTTATPEQIRALRASAPSGDWRPIGGSLELVAVCQVNVPGFPIARARVASGQVYALVAAGASTLARMKSDPLQDMKKRLDALEKLSVVSEDTKSKAEELSNRVRSTFAYDELGYISTKTREKLAKEGKALPDGSYPIRNIEELKDAIQAYGRSKPSKRAAVRRHIMKRARSLKRADLIPEKWKNAGLVDDDVVDGIKARVQSLTIRAAVESGDADPKAPPMQ